MEPAFLSAVEQARLIRERQISSVELVELYLGRIERIDPQLNSFVTVCAEEALADARSADASTDDAPFRGVPTAIKDLSATAGIRTTFSSHAYADYVPDFDSAVVAASATRASWSSARRTRPSSGRSRSRSRT